MNKKELENLVNSSDKITEYWRNYEKEIHLFIDSSEIKQTAEALYFLINHSESILNGVINSVVDNSLYSSNILYRSLTEYFLRVIYIYLRAINENCDDVGYEFNIHLKENEKRQYNNSISEINDYVKQYGLIVNKKYLKKTDNSIPHDKIMIAKNNFSYRNIIKYLFQNNNLKKLQGPSEMFFFIVLQEYLELSSFVHGGPTSTEIFAWELQKDDFEGINEFLVDRSLKMCNLEKYYAINLFVNHDLKFSVPNAQIILELIKQSTEIL